MENIGVWTEHKAPDDRIYYYNTATKKSQWKKPDELKTRAELLMDSCPWKEHAADNGKTYYHNMVTKESTWTIPKELEEIKAMLAGDEGLKAQTKAQASGLETGENTVPTQNQNLSSTVGQMTEVTEKIQYSNKDEAKQAFIGLLKEKQIPSYYTWDAVMKVIVSDPRYAALPKMNERKLAFNEYKTKKSKEEKEEQRVKVRLARERLTNAMFNHPKMGSYVRWRQVCELFEKEQYWQDIPERDKRDIYDDIIIQLSKKEKKEEEEKRDKDRNKILALLRTISEITYSTTWGKAQEILDNDNTFNNDCKDIDKLDTLFAFQDHIRELEKQEEENRLAERNNRKRQERKNRESFLNLLDELHTNGNLDANSAWKLLFLVIRTDSRFTVMLGQRGSSPLDLFKFYVDDLKNRYHDEKKIIKEILKDKFEVETTTKLEEFFEIITCDPRSQTLDKGNATTAYYSLLEKAEARERDRLKAEEKKMRRLEGAFKAMLKSHTPPILLNAKWEEYREIFINNPAFEAVTIEAERIRLFEEFINELDGGKGDQSVKPSHHKSKKSKKHRNKRSRSRSISYSDDEESSKRSRRKSKKHKRSISRSRSRSPASDSDHDSRRRKHKKKSKKRRRRSHSSDSSRSAESRRNPKSPSRSPRISKGSIEDTGHSTSESELETRRRELLKKLEETN
ncbi:Pre-mRNA-processing factor 40-like protein A [Trichoplax sp. H2]|nr:Pre-mRNA-processing factor 40-like protein A [Trichoplax sp. H2]|eukprot:RDD41174.1 Pre-mRNA-processing factor 40-like protein A [Trichoplax sp. H2]